VGGLWEDCGKEAVTELRIRAIQRMGARDDIKINSCGLEVKDGKIHAMYAIPKKLSKRTENITSDGSWQITNGIIDWCLSYLQKD